MCQHFFAGFQGSDGENPFGERRVPDFQNFILHGEIHTVFPIYGSHSEALHLSAVVGVQIKQAAQCPRSTAWGILFLRVMDLPQTDITGSFLKPVCQLLRLAAEL